MKKYTPFTISHPDQFNTNNIDIAKNVLSGIKYACKNKLSAIVLGRLVVESKFKDLLLHHSQYTEALNSILKTLEFYEEYELCAELIKLNKSIQKIEFINADNNLAQVLLNLN